MPALSLTSPLALAAGAAVAVAALLAAMLRRPALPRPSLALAGAAAAMLCLATGGFIWHRPEQRTVLIRVDLSPSTRSADYRRRERLDARIRQLLPGVPYRIESFSDGFVATPPESANLPDIPAERTMYPPASADAVVLFSDCRFALPAAGPATYVVLDPGLESPPDGAVMRLEVRDRSVSVAVTNNGLPRALSLGGVEGSAAPTTAPAGSYTITRPLLPQASAISAQLSPGDAWPENDALAALPPPPRESESWWVGVGAPGSGWRSFSPASLPSDAAAYLAPAVIVLNNVPAGALGEARQERLGQYVRDLGGALVILGGEHAFAAGDYPGSMLEALSPLASTPPRPTTHWMLLADSSGSMSAPVTPGGLSHWQFATAAMVGLLPHLPPADLVSVGNFSDVLRWWSFGKSARDTAALSLPPPDVFPNGPTNLEAALLDIAKSADTGLPKQLLLLTDADARIDDAKGIGALMKQKNIHLHLLAIGEGSGLPALHQIITASDGSLVRQFEPSRWAESVAELMRAASPALLRDQSLAVGFEADLASLPPVNVAPSNRTWLKESAQALGQGTDEADHPVVAARWAAGEGQVLAVAFGAEGAVIDAAVRLVARAPRDPRFKVNWDAGPELHVSIDAADGEKYLNGQQLTLQLTEDSAARSIASHAIPQTGPGRYELSLPAPRTPVFAALKAGGHVIDRIAVAARYAPEFDAIGNEHEAMESLARRTGGRVIDPAQTRPIHFEWPRHPVSMTPWLAALGALLLAAALGYWRVG